MSWMGAWFGAEEVGTEVPAQQPSGGGGPDGIPFDAPHRAAIERRAREKLKRQMRDEVLAEIRIELDPRAVVEQDAEPRHASPVAESLAHAVSDSGDAGVATGLERVSPQQQIVAAPVPQTAAVDFERARIAAKVRQQREIEEIMTVLMMAA